eukprot:1366980-Prymnesium_polylepis.1
MANNQRWDAGSPAHTSTPFTASLLYATPPSPRHIPHPPAHPSACPQNSSTCSRECSPSARDRVGYHTDVSGTSSPTRGRRPAASGSPCTCLCCSSASGRWLSAETHSDRDGWMRRVDETSG